MSKKFTSGSDLYKYECMMQELPFGHVSSKEEKKAKGRYLSILRQFMSDKGFGSIYKKVSENIKDLPFDRVPFKDNNHRDMFFSAYSKCGKQNGRKVNNTKTAVIYLLSTNRVFYKTLESYISNPIYSLEGKIKGIISEESYNLYQAVKKLSGLESGLQDEDLTDDGIINDSTISLIINAMYLKEYGLNGRKAHKKPSKTHYINNSKLQHKHYCYKGQTVKIRKRKW